MNRPDDNKLGFNVTDSQSKAILHPPGPLMILAGAGTGKTTTLVRRVDNLIKTELALPEEILILTFTEKAARELQEKLKNLVGNKAKKMTISTFHALCLQLVKQYGENNVADMIHWDDTDKIFFLLSHVDEMDFLSSRSFRSNPATAISKSFLPFINRVQDELVAPETLVEDYNKLELTNENILTEFPFLSNNPDVDDIKNQWSDLVHIYKFFQDAKTKFNAIDYGDMVMKLWDLINTKQSVLENIQNEFKHIFIDEYQDNNVSLNKIMNLIAGQRAWITVVGDEDQCIYSFRGANYFNIQDFRNRYAQDQNYSEVKLVENHRSSTEILNLANASIKNNTNRDPKLLRTSDKNPKSGPAPQWIHAEKRESAAVIAKLVQNHIDRSGDYGDCAVICRTTKQLTFTAQELQKLGIPVDLHVEQFFGVPIIKDILAWSEIILSSNKSGTAIVRILNQLIGRDLTKKISTHCKINKISMVELEWTYADRLTRKEERNLKSFKISVETLRHKVRQNINPDEMIWSILSEIKHFPKIVELRTSYRYMDRLNLINLGHLISVSTRFSSLDNERSLNDWLNYMNTLKNYQKMEAIQPITFDSSSAVQLLTVHKSKGLEFPVVFIPYLRSQSFPLGYKHSPSLNQLPVSMIQWNIEGKLTPKDEHMQEERRIFYVACTRAKDHLFLIGPTKASSIFTKELKDLKTPVMEVSDMSDHISDETKLEESQGRQKLVTNLNRDIAAHQYENAQEILEQLKSIDLGPSENEKIETEWIPDKMIHLSASKIEAYKQCGLKFRLKYMDNVPEGKSQPVMEFGSIIHKVLEDYHKEGSEHTLENILKLLDTYWNKDVFEYTTREIEFKEQGKEILENYYHFTASNTPNVVGTENKFSFLIKDLQVTISGKIDRIDRDENGNLSVIDYKTGGSKSQKAKSSLQLALYTEAIKENTVENISGNPGSAKLHWLRDEENPIDEYTFKDEDLVKQMDGVAKAAEGIRKGLFEPKPSDFVCQMCDYKDFLCKAWEED